MKSYLATTALVAFALIVVACASVTEQPQPAAEPPSQAEDVAAIKAMPAKYEAAYNASDAAALAELHTEEAIRMPPNEPALVGKEAIQSWYQTRFDQFTPQVTVSHEEVEVAGDWAFARGSYTSTQTPKAGGEPVEDSGKFLTISKRQPDGSWKIYRTIYNSDNPLPGAGN